VKGTWLTHAGFGLLALASAASAQEAGAPEAGRPVTPLKVHMVIAKQVGDKKISSMAYDFPCNANDRKVVMKMGVEVPVPVRKGESLEIQYRNVGANLECEASVLPGGRFNLRLAVEQSSLYTHAGTPAQRVPAPEDQTGSSPVFRTSTSMFSAVLRDGETARSISGTEPMTGEVVTFDVTLAVAK
jgi:hypothetical protein